MIFPLKAPFGNDFPARFDYQRLFFPKLNHV